MKGISTTKLVLMPDPCRGNVAAAILRGKLYLTQNDFTTLRPLPAPADMPNFTVKRVVFMFKYLVVADDNSNIYYLHMNGTNFAKFEMGKTLVVKGIGSHDWCIEGLYINLDIDTLVVWSEKRLYLSNNLEPVTEIPLPITEIQNRVDGYVDYNIEDVRLDIKPGRIGVALKVRISNSGEEQIKVLFTVYDSYFNTWSHSPFFANFKAFGSGVITFYFLGLAKSSFYFRNQNSLFYSYDDSASFGAKRIYGSNLTRLATEGTEIRDVIVSRMGDVSVLLTTNQILYGKVKQPEYVLFDSFHLPDDLNTLHWFDELNQLHFVTVDENGKPTKIEFPLRNELTMALAEDQKCEYHNFVHNIHEQVYFLDMQDRLDFWVLLVFWKTDINSIEYVLSDANEVINFIHHIHVNYVGSNIGYENLTIQFTHPPDGTNPNLRTGIAILELRPFKRSLNCLGEDSAIIYISVGCPHQRELKLSQELLKVQACSGSLALKNEYSDTNYRIDGSVLIDLKTGQLANPDSSVDLMYNINAWGCPIRLNNSGLFKPTFDLYDEGIRKEPVNADFVIYEIHGRRDISYTIDQEEGGCYKEAQSWAEMRKLAEGNDSIEIDDIWTFENYRPCYKKIDDTLDSFDEHVTSQYEIINATNNNQLKFSVDYDGIYVIKALIISPDYSFCRLSVTFAVEVVGMKPPNDLGIVALTNYLVFALIIIGLISTYIWFHKTTVRKVGIPDQDPPKVLASSDDFLKTKDE